MTKELVVVLDWPQSTAEDRTVWRGLGKPVAWDVTIPDTFANLHLDATAAGSAANSTSLH